MVFEFSSEDEREASEDVTDCSEAVASKMKVARARARSAAVSAIENLSPAQFALTREAARCRGDERERRPETEQRAVRHASSAAKLA